MRGHSRKHVTQHALLPILEVSRKHMSWLKKIFGDVQGAQREG